MLRILGGAGHIIGQPIAELFAAAVTIASRSSTATNLLCVCAVSPGRHRCVRSRSTPGWCDAGCLR